MKGVSVLDLRKSYLQIHIDESQLLHQPVKWKGKTYLLFRLGFGLSSAPKIMTRIVNFVIDSTANMKMVVSSYINDLYVNESSVCRGN